MHLGVDLGKKKGYEARLMTREEAEKWYSRKPIGVSEWRPWEEMSEEEANQLDTRSRFSLGGNPTGY